MPNWERWAKNARNLFKDAEYPLPMNTPKFLGYTINDYNLSKGKPTKAFAELMDRISDVVNQELVPNLKNEGMLLDDNKYNKLIAMSNDQSIPIFELGNSGMQEGQKRTLEWFKALFDMIADKILLMTYDEKS